MQRDEVIDRAAAPTIEVARNIAADQLDAPTPCQHYSVRQLVNHLLFWAPSLAGAARKEVVPLLAASDLQVDLTDGDWSARLEADFERLATAWSDPAAWEGETRLGGPDAVPAAMIGGMGVHRAGHPRLGPGPRDRPKARVGRGGGRLRLPGARRHRRAGQGDGPVRASGRVTRAHLDAGSRPRLQRP